MSADRFPLLIKQLLLNVREQGGDNEIVYRGEVRLRYPQFLDRVHRLGSALVGAGVEKGDVVAVMDWDTHRYLECFYAIPMSGAMLQTVNIRLSIDQILYTLRDTAAKIILCNTEFAPLLARMLPDLPAAEKIVCLSDDRTRTDDVDWWTEYEAWLAAADPTFAFPDFDENLPATTFYTSGTTGLPKRVFYSHRQIVLHTLGALGTLALGDRSWHVNRDTVYMPVTPMFHAHAWGFPYVATMIGCKQVYPGRYVPEKLIELCRTEKPTFSHCVPTLLHMILTASEATDIDLSGWQVLIGGAAISSGLLKQATDRGIVIITGFGMSETGPLVSLTRVRPEAVSDPAAETALRTKAGSPTLLVDMRIVDEAMNEVPRGETGEVVLRAPWLTDGYWGDPPASEALWHGGYLHTQDLGYLDDHGYLRITDRKKDVIKSGGEWISSLLIEDLISRHPAVSEAAVIGIPDPQWQERPLGLVVLKPDCCASPSDIRDHLLAFVERGDITRYAVPDTVEFLEALERTSVGKIDKKALRARFAPA